MRSYNSILVQAKNRMLSTVQAKKLISSILISSDSNIQKIMNIIMYGSPLVSFTSDVCFNWGDVFFVYLAAAI